MDLLKIGKRQLSGDGIGEEGAKAMSEMLLVNTTLTSLNLRGEEEKEEKEKEKKDE